jgi:hypothetical protein
MIYNKIKFLIIIAFFCCIFTYINCERNLTNPQNDKHGSIEEQEYVKDGIMTLTTSTRYRLPDGSTDRAYDSLFVSETDNRVSIANGVPFYLPEMWYLEINFLGNFEGMPNKIFYFFTYKRKSEKYGIVKERESGQVTSKRTAVILTSIGNTAFDISGILFALDSDNEHTGSGEVIIEHDNIPVDTLSIDAKQNTVVFGSNATNLPMTLGPSDICIDVLIEDWYSFLDENIRVVWFVEDEATDNLSDLYVTPIQGQFLAEQYSTNVLLWAFATRFEQVE